MTKHLETAILSVILLICLCILSLLVYKIVPTECTHKNLDVTVIDVTCTDNGYTKNICLDCGAEFNTNEIAALGHTYKDTKVNPTCTENGYTIHKCEVCGDEYKDQTVNASGHELEITVTAPTCEKKGYTLSACKNCDFEEKSAEVDATGHTEVIDRAISATCTQSGLTQGKHCSVCQTVTVAQNIVPALTHNMIDVAEKPATCGAFGYTAHKECSRCGYTEGKATIPATNEHILVDVDGKDSSCTEEGYTDHQLCSTCGYTEGKTTIEKKDHDLVDIQAKENTCLEDGYTAHKECSVCQYTENKTVIPASHDLIDIEGKDATCNEPGYTSYKDCSKCDYIEGKEPIPASHKLIDVPEKAATCYINGYTAHKACENCDYVNEAYQTIEAKHNYVYTSTVPSDCLTRGYDVYTCTKCYDKYEDNYTPAAHLISNELHETVLPTCTERGYDAYLCTREGCHYIYKTHFVDALQHDYDNGVTIEASADTAGYTVYTCQTDDCGHTYISDVIAPTGEHNFVKQTLVAPTFDNQGYTVYKCSDDGCEATYNDNYVFYSDVLEASKNSTLTEAVNGLDLSKFAVTEDNRNVDFEALKASGIEFVILRIASNSERDDNVDPYFLEFYTAAKAAGLDVGAYFFSFATNVEEAIRDAEFVAKWLDHYNVQLEYPVYYDIENAPVWDHYPSDFDQFHVTEIVKAFAERMLEHGYFPGLYSQRSFIYTNDPDNNSTLYNPDEIANICDVWLAHYWVSYPDGSEDYTEHINNNIDNYKDKFGIWQYQGDVYGYLGAMDGACDLNLGFRDYPALIKLYGFNGFTVPEIEEEPEAPSPENPEPEEPQPEEPSPESPTPEPTPEGGEENLEDLNPVNE